MQNFQPPSDAFWLWLKVIGVIILILRITVAKKATVEGPDEKELFENQLIEAKADKKTPKKVDKAIPVDNHTDEAESVSADWLKKGGAYINPKFKDYL